jgi:hypothetical protein
VYIGSGGEEQCLRFSRLQRCKEGNMDFTRRHFLHLAAGATGLSTTSPLAQAQNATIPTICFRNENRDRDVQ